MSMDGGRLLVVFKQPLNIFLIDVTRYAALAVPSFVSQALPFTYIISMLLEHAIN